MGGIPAGAYIPLGAITAAVIAGLFSYFSLILSKEQKLSEFRQCWIDGLRDDLSSFIAAVLSVAYLDDVYRKHYGERLNFIDLATAIREPHMKASICFSHIMLRLNPHDESAVQRDLIRVLEEVRNAFAATDYDTASNKFPELREKAQLVLKAEWERVKSGERTYQWSKRITLLVLAGALAIGAFVSIKSLTRPAVGPAANDSNSIPKADVKGPSSK
jgi:hypothetical protein